MFLDGNPNEYDYDEYYGTTLAEDRKALIEDFEHLYFIATGIVLCAISNWQAAFIAALATVFIRDVMRTCERKAKVKKK